MNIRHDNVCLILTASIIPNTNNVALIDVAQRREQYLKALECYRAIFKGKIYFLENSEYDFTADHEFSSLFDERVKLIKFNLQDENNQGKGYLEFKMLDRFFEQNIVAEPFFIKITGRYLVKNLLNLIPDNYNYVIADAHKKMKVTLTGVFICSVNDYKQNIAGLYKQVNDANGIFIEHIIYKNLTVKDKTQLFGENPYIEGVSGSYGESLKRNPLKMKIRQVERKILNKLNINQFLIEY